VGVLAADAVAGETGHVIEFGTNAVATGHWQLAGTQRREALLGVDVE